MFKKFAHFTNWDFHLSVYKKEFKTGVGSEDLHPLVLSQGGIYLNRAARASPNRVPPILQIDYHPSGSRPYLKRKRLGGTYSLEIGIDYLASEVQQVRWKYLLANDCEKDPAHHFFLLFFGLTFLRGGVYRRRKIFILFLINLAPLNMITLQMNPF